MLIIFRIHFYLKASFSLLRSDNPVKAKDIFEKSELLVTLAKHGNFRKFCLLVDSCEKDDIMPYFIPKMFKEALFANNLMIVKNFISIDVSIMIFLNKLNRLLIL